MHILKLKAAMINVLVVLLGSLALTPWMLGRGAEVVELVVPMGALAHAAAALERATGGKILEIRLGDTTGAPVFEAAVAKDDGLLYMRIASPSDDITEISVKDLPPWLLNYHLQAYARSIAKARVPLGDAIIKAEKRDRAPAVDGGIAKPLDGTNAVLAYFVETLQGARRQELVVDATTGAFVEDPGALYEPNKPVELARRLAEL
jgi:uncharacterized membrane protein YkoI